MTGGAHIAGAQATIVAIATPPGPATRGVVRGSGPAAEAMLRETWRDSEGTAFGSGMARGVYEGHFLDDRGAIPARLYWMPGPRSFTREDVFELHLPGSPFLLRATVQHLLQLGARMAEPGEFTRRAFHSGRIDLSRAEGVLALVEARNGSERRAATQLLAGGLEKRMAALRETLDTTRALCEASLDFDETDTGHVPEEELRSGARAARDLLLEAQTWERDRVPEAGLPRVVLAGRPNAGKSELFNRLCIGAEAIVAPIAGTTRDTVRAEWHLPGGSHCLLSDTAGEEKDSDVLVGGDELRRLRGAAQDVAFAERSAADIILWVVDGGSPAGAAFDLEAARKAGAGSDRPMILCWNQVDRPGVNEALLPELRSQFLSSGASAVVACSGKTGEGIPELSAQVESVLLSSEAGEGGDQNLSRELSLRHGEALRASAERIDQALVALDGGLPLEVFAEELRRSSEELDAITGRTVTERLLDRIFSRFCLGK